MPEDQGQVDPAEALMREVGAQLRQVRLERGEDLEEVAEYLRIKPTYLYGIEQGDLSVMPGRTYALGFLRSYADYLGFDGDDLINQIKWTVENLTGKTRLQIRTPLPESRLPKMPVVVLSLAVLAGVYAGWSYMNRSSDLVVETVAEVPDSLRRMAMEALPATGPEPAPDTTAELRTDAPDAESASPERTVEPATPIAASEPPAEPAGGVAEDPQLQPSGTAAVPARPAEEEVALAPEDAAPAAAPDEEQDTVDLEILPSTAPLTSATAARSLTAAPPAARETPDRPTRTALASDLNRARALAPDAGPDDAPPADEAPRVRTAVLAPGGPGAEQGAVPTPAPSAAPEPAGEVTPADQEQADPTSAAAVVAALTGRTSLEEGPGADGQGPQVLETVNGDARVILRANDSSWLQITSEGGDYLRSRTLEPGDLLLVPNRPDLQLWTGNAGGLDVFVDGEALPPLGPAGAVVRDVSLDPERLKSR